MVTCSSGQRGKGQCTPVHPSVSGRDQCGRTTVPGAGWRSADRRISATVQSATASPPGPASKCSPSLRTGSPSSTSRHGWPADTGGRSGPPPWCPRRQPPRLAAPGSCTRCAPRIPRPRRRSTRSAGPCPAPRAHPWRGAAPPGGRAGCGSGGRTPGHRRAPAVRRAGGSRSAGRPAKKKTTSGRMVRPGPGVPPRHTTGAAAGLARRHLGAAVRRRRPSSRSGPG